MHFFLSKKSVGKHFPKWTFEVLLFVKVNPTSSLILMNQKLTSNWHECRAWANMGKSGHWLERKIYSANTRCFSRKDCGHRDKMVISCFLVHVSSFVHLIDFMSFHIIFYIRTDINLSWKKDNNNKILLSTRLLNYFDKLTKVTY